VVGDFKKRGCTYKQINVASVTLVCLFIGRGQPFYFGGVAELVCAWIFFFNPLIHTDFFSRGMCLEDIFFYLKHSA